MVDAPAGREEGKAMSFVEVGAGTRSFPHAASQCLALFSFGVQLTRLWRGGADDSMTRSGDLSVRQLAGEAMEGDEGGAVMFF